MHQPTYYTNFFYLCQVVLLRYKNITTNIGGYVFSPLLYDFEVLIPLHDRLHIGVRNGKTHFVRLKNGQSSAVVYDLYKTIPLVGTTINDIIVAEELHIMEEITQAIFTCTDVETHLVIVTVTPTSVEIHRVSEILSERRGAFISRREEDGRLVINTTPSRKGNFSEVIVNGKRFVEEN